MAAVEADTKIQGVYGGEEKIHYYYMMIFYF